VADLRGERVSGRDERATWWAVAFIAGAVVGWLIAESGGIFIGIAFLFPFGIGGSRVRAAIGGALTGAGLAVLGVHGLAPDLTTLGAGLTLVVGLFATWQAFRRP
jgi:hypothetical protein